MLDNQVPEDVLFAVTKKLMLVKASIFLFLLLIVSAIIGFWLAYHRVLESIYG